MGWKHLSAEGRETLERCLSLGMSLRKVSVILGYSAAALCKELKRNATNGKYRSGEAHMRAVKRRNLAAHRTKSMQPELVAYIFEKMRQYWSPEQIHGRLMLDYPDAPSMRVSFKTMYRKISAGSDATAEWSSLYPYFRLKRRGKSMKGHMKINPGPAGTLPSIELRPPVVDAKTRFGDWESDLVCGPKGKGYIATFVERTTGLLLAAECSRHAQGYKQVAINILGSLPKGTVHTVTVDRGSEFFAYRDLEEQLDVKYYFCHPRCPNERGLNEQINGLLRQFFPKNQPLLYIKNALAKAVALINHRPRKRLGYKTPVEAVKALGNEQLLTLVMTI